MSVLIHRSQFPLAVEAALHESLRTRAMSHKFHYDTPKQTLRWLRLHEALSPARTDPGCLRIYEDAFARCAHELVGSESVEVVSLGCGGGQKDVQLLQSLSRADRRVRLRYVPVDVSVGLALTAREAALRAGLLSQDVVPMVVDLAEAEDWTSALADGLGASARRVVCFFGMLPNFLPGAVLPQLARLVRPSDLLLLSANLAPGSDYRAGVERVLPLYDNEMTRDWLWSVLLDLGVERADGRMDFVIRDAGEGDGLLRIESNVTFLRPCRISYAGSVYDFAIGDTFRLFFSCRHTPARVAASIRPHGLQLMESWCNSSGEEGVFLCGK